MKKLLSIIAAGLIALTAISCVKQEDMAVVDFSNATPPTLVSYEVGNDIVAQYNPAVFKMGFNQKMKTYHTFAVVSIDGNSADMTLSAKDDGSKLTLSGKSLSNLLKNRGYQPFDEVAVELVVRGSIQDPARGITNGFVDSKEKIAINWTVPEDQQGSPYDGYDNDSEWTLIGAMAAYEINWDGDLNMWTDGDGNHVAAHVTLKAGDEVKFRKNLGWTDNYGGDFGSVGSEFSVSQDGPNIKIAVDGVYDLFLYEGSQTALVAEAYDPYPEYTEASNWSVIGALAEQGINWDGDIAMISDGSNHVALGVALAADDEFKFRQDKGWAVNLGGEFGGLDADFSVTQDGPNIKVGAAGVFDLFVNPDAGTARVATASGAKVSSVVGGDEPEPEPEPVVVKGWNIIGLNGDWENDVLATEDSGVWTAYITANEATEFKWRKDGAWDENYGGTLVSLGTPFAAVAGGDNIAVGAGFYKVVLDLSDEANPTITVYDDFEVWSLIGDFNGWGGDVDMTLVDGLWIVEDVELTPGWKIRKNHGWDENRGGTFVNFGEPFAAVAGGDNIDCGTGKFTVIYDPEQEAITINEGTVWSLIGNFNEWGGDVDMVEKDGVWVAESVDLTPGWKIRKNHDWTENRGGTFVSFGEPFEAVAGGDNIDCGTGMFNVVYDPANETITVSASSYGWSVIGANGDWNTDIDMTEVMPGVWMSATITTDTDWKIRFNHDWEINRGGDTPSAEGEFVKAVPGGSNIGQTGTFKVVYNANNETIGTLVWGVVGSIASIPGFSWNNDVPMNLASDGKWYSIPVKLTTTDEIKIRQYAGWDNNRGGDCVSANEAFEVTNGGNNIKAPEDGTYMLVYDPEAETITLSTAFWGLIGDFNEWGADLFMMYTGSSWEAYGLTLAGGWKIRQGAGWDINRGGTFAEQGTAFEAVPGGDNINVGELAGFDVIYDPENETITVK